jgi:hypothetical protein
MRTEHLNAAFALLGDPGAARGSEVSEVTPDLSSFL